MLFPGGEGNSLLSVPSRLVAYTTPGENVLELLALILEQSGVPSSPILEMFAPSPAVADLPIEQISCCEAAEADQADQAAHEEDHLGWRDHFCSLRTLVMVRY